MKPETKQKLKKIFPPLGMRIIKTALALFVAMIISDYALKPVLPNLNTNSVCVFAVLSMQDSVKGTWKFIFERILGNILGLSVGFLFLFLFTVTGTVGKNGEIIDGNFVFYAFIAFGTLLTIYLCKMINRTAVSAVTIIVFLGIMFGAAEINPYLNGAYTVLQLALGIIISVIINILLFPPKAKKTDLSECHCEEHSDAVIPHGQLPRL